MSDQERFLHLLRSFGAEAASFAAVKSDMRYWFDEESESEKGAGVAYADDGRVWVAAGRPLTDPLRLPRVAATFLARAIASGRSACFFATEACDLDGFSCLLLGEQPVWHPAEWEHVVSRHRRLREQIRRAAAKGVRVRRVDPRELHPGTPMRTGVEALAQHWLASRRMEPLRFLVALEPMHFPSEHIYLAAERDGRLVAFLSAVPIYATRGWLVEDMVRHRGAPNGTAEALVDAVMRETVQSEFVTLGLAPLSGPVSLWLKVIAWSTRSLYDFRGVRLFKERLRPARWQKVWLMFPRSGRASTHLLASLRAFAGGSLLAFAARSMVRRPSALPWVLAVPLVPWTLLLLGLVVSGHSQVLGWSARALGTWVGFDVFLIALLLQSAARPRPARLGCSAAAAALDAGLSVLNLTSTGLGGTLVHAALRGVATFAPCVAVVALSWATVQAVGRSQAT